MAKKSTQLALHKKDLCPFCKGDNTDMYDHDLCGEGLFVGMYECHECNRSWTVEFKPVKLEEIV